VEIVEVFKCDECGFDNAALDNDGLAASVGSFAKRYRMPLTRFLANEDGNAIVRRRPAPEVWSALEYAAHYRDVIDFYARRIDAILSVDRPQLGGFDIEGEAERGDYNVLDPATVADEIGAASESLHARLATLQPGDWARVGIAIDGTSERDVRNCVSRVSHEGGHHLLDIGRSLRAARDTAKLA